MENSKKTPEQLRARALEFTKLADKYSNMSRHASDNAPGSYITGSSGRTKSQNKRTEAALNRTIKYAKLAVYYRARAASLERQAKWNEDKPARDAANAKRLQEDKANARAINRGLWSTSGRT